MSRDTVLGVLSGLVRTVFAPDKLSPSERAKVDVLNGIVYDAANDRIYVTGKNWPKLFEIRAVAR